MRFLCLLTAMGLITLSSSHAVPCASQPATLAGLRNCSRPLVIFASSTADRTWRRQVAELRAHAEALRERDIVVVLLVESGAGATRELDGLPSAHFGAGEQARIRARLGAGAGKFTIVLIGKDGGEKLRRHALLTTAVLGETVDAMPMRQNEMTQAH